MSIIPESDLKAIRLAVSEAEKKTSAEIRVIIEEKCKTVVLDRAAFAFRKLKMHETEHRNGVLIYVAIKDHQCAVIGDSGINQLVQKDFWQTIIDEMIVFFSAGQLKEGIIHALNRTAIKLGEHFPVAANDRNELPNDVITKL